MIYRVTIRNTGSLQPGRGNTYWQTESVYCGASLEEARVAYLREVVSDHGAGYGNPVRETRIEQFESEPDEIDDDAAEPDTHGCGCHCPECGHAL